ncbi:MAG: FAD-dependent oxidoreductase, partial [Bacteroides sp.]|nr:FAD-dependent oxidoreductase [Bacteroides sp.]
MKYLIIGGVAGGATAAARIRRLSEDAEIILFEKGEYISYANCGLPYYIGGVIKERERLLVQTAEGFGRRFGIDVRVRSEVTAIDREGKTVTVVAPDGSTYTESYDRLLLSPGASPVRPPLPGIDLEGIYTLRNVTDTDVIKARIATGKVRRAVIVGGGFIGLEMAENLSHAGAEVAVVEMAPQVMAPIDFSMAQIVHAHLAEKGVRLYTESAVASFTRRDDELEVHLADGRTIAADMVILSIGVRPNTALAAAAGIELGPMRGIKVDGYLRTVDKSIYAVGDAIEYPHPVTGRPWLNYLAGPANRQARIVADNMVKGDTTVYEGAIGTSIAKVFDLTVAATGLAAKRLRADGIEYLTATIHPASHAGYYPDAMPMTIKVVFAPADGRLLGAQIVGYDGVDKRIDLLAQCIKSGGTVADLTRIEQAYAPPFSSAKDPVAIAGYVAQNILSGKMRPIYWRELASAEPGSHMLIDVRTPMEYAAGALPGAVNIPLDDMRERLAEIPADRPIVVYCGVGLRGYLASNILRLRGYSDVRNLIGGIKTYRTATAPVAPPEPMGAGASPTSAPAADAATVKIDACGLSCPGPIMKLKEAVEGLAPGQTLEVTATDPGFARDAEAWCRTTANTFLSAESAAGKYRVAVQRGAAGSA